MHEDKINIILEIENVIDILDKITFSIMDFSKAVVNIDALEILEQLEVQNKKICDITQNNLQNSYKRIKSFCLSQTLIPVKYEVKNINLKTNKPLISTFYPSAKLFAIVRAKGFKTTELTGDLEIIGSKKRGMILGLAVCVNPIHSEPVVFALNSLPSKASLVKMDYSYQPALLKPLGTIESFLTPDSLFMIGFNVNDITPDDIGKKGFIKIYDQIRALQKDTPNLASLEMNRYPVTHIGLDFDIIMNKLQISIKQSNYDKLQINEYIDLFLETIEAEKARLVSLFKRLKIRDVAF